MAWKTIALLVAFITAAVGICQVKQKDVTVARIAGGNSVKITVPDSTITRQPPRTMAVQTNLSEKQAQAEFQGNSAQRPSNLGQVNTGGMGTLAAIVAVMVSFGALLIALRERSAAMRYGLYSEKLRLHLQFADAYGRFFATATEFTRARFARESSTQMDVRRDTLYNAVAIVAACTHRMRTICEDEVVTKALAVHDSVVGVRRAVEYPFEDAGKMAHLQLEAAIGDWVLAARKEIGVLPLSIQAKELFKNSSIKTWKDPIAEIGPDG
jgi:hypothetical protein